MKILEYFKKRKNPMGVYETSGQFNSMQLSQIHMGLAQGLNVELYANPEISADTMYSCRVLLLEGFTEKELKQYLESEMA